MAEGNAWGPRVPDARCASASTEDAPQRWADDPQSLDPVGACDLDSAAFYEQALLSEADLHSDQLWAAFDAWQQGGSEGHDASAGVDVVRFKPGGWHRMDDLDFEIPWLDAQPSTIQVLIHQTERATRLAALKQLGRKPQIPPDLVVKFQPIDIVDVIL